MLVFPTSLVIEKNTDHSGPLPNNIINNNNDSLIIGIGVAAGAFRPSFVFKINLQNVAAGTFFVRCSKMTIC